MSTKPLKRIINIILLLAKVTNALDVFMCRHLSVAPLVLKLKLFKVNISVTV